MPLSFLLCVTLVLLLQVKIFSTQLTSDQYLTHHWPFDDSTMQDVIGSAHMTQGSNTTFTSDRFGNPNSALALNTGYTIVPSGVYFNTPSFTISVWVYPKGVKYHARIIDFSPVLNSYENRIYWRNCSGTKI